MKYLMELLSLHVWVKRALSPAFQKIHTCMVDDFFDA